MALPNFQRLPLDEPLSEDALKALPSSAGNPGPSLMPAPLAVAKLMGDDTVEVTMPVAVKTACRVDAYPVIRTYEGKAPVVHIADDPFSVGTVQPGQTIQIGVVLPKAGDAAGFALVYNGQLVAMALRMYS